MRVKIKHFLQSVFLCLLTITMLFSCSAGDDYESHVNQSPNETLISLNISGKVYYKSPVSVSTNETSDNPDEDIYEYIPIEGIKVMLLNNNTFTYTDENGAYILEEKSVNIDNDNVVLLLFTDVDGENNGGMFEDVSRILDNIVWYDNMATITVNVEMTPLGILFDTDEDF